MLDSRRGPKEAKILRLLNGELAAAEAEALWKDLRNDPDARRLYDRLAESERALEGPDDSAALGLGANARVGARLWHSLDAQTKVPWWREIRWPAMAMAACAAIMLITIVPVLNRATNDDGFQARSGGANMKISPDFVLQVLQIEVAAQGELRVRPAKRLRIGDELRLAAFSRREPCRISVVAVRSDGRRRVLLERANLRPTQAAQRLDVALSVPSDWRGPVRFVGLFEYGQPVNLETFDLAAKDRQDFAVRSVSTTVDHEDDRP